MKITTEIAETIEFPLNETAKAVVFIRIDRDNKYEVFDLTIEHANEVVAHILYPNLSDLIYGLTHLSVELGFVCKRLRKYEEFLGIEPFSDYQEFVTCLDELEKFLHHIRAKIQDVWQIEEKQNES